MKYIKLFTYLAISTLVLVSCNKKFDKEKKEWKDDKIEKNDCFDIVYPLVYLMPDGTNVSMENGDDWDGVKAWYNENDTEEKPTLIYPVQVRANEALMTLFNDEEFESWKKDIC